MRDGALDLLPVLTPDEVATLDHEIAHLVRAIERALRLGCRIQIEKNALNSQRTR
jgi:hypothetical protein